MDKNKTDSLYIRNLSFGGAFLETKNPYPQETLVEISFDLPGSEKSVQATGFVSWISNKDESVGMGIQFIAISQQDQDILRKFIRESCWRLDECLHF